MSGRYELSSVAGEKTELEVGGWNVAPPIPALRPEGEEEAIEWGRAEHTALFPCRGMCYNHRAVEDGAKQEVVLVNTESAEAVSGKAAQEEPSSSMATKNEDASRYCPVCSQRMESRRCKLICGVCGYYMSCADYY